VYKSALIISNPDDVHTQVVAQKIAALGVQPVLFYPEQLGDNVAISVQWSDTEPFPKQVLIFADSGNVDVGQIGAIWFRRPRHRALESYGMSGEGSRFAQEEWRAALDGIYASLDNALWVSHPDNLLLAARKSRQMVLARQTGFVTPPTLITNDPREARAFVQQHGRRVIVKATGNGWVYTDDGNAVTYVMTNRLSESDFAELSAIASAPVTFQREISKDYEIRVNVVGREILAIRIDSQMSGISELDWRRYDVENTPYSPYKLPFEIERKCLKLTQKLGLEFGAIDLIRQPNGDYVFLEINGNGQFLWAEELSGVAVSDSLARLLAGRARPLKSATLT